MRYAGLWRGRWYEGMRRIHAVVLGGIQVCKRAVARKGMRERGVGLADPPGRAVERAMGWGERVPWSLGVACGRPGRALKEVRG